MVAIDPSLDGYKLGLRQSMTLHRTNFLSLSKQVVI